MSIQRFVAANSREAMRLVRAALGEDALILANREVAEGFEILAVAEDAVPPPGSGTPVMPTASASEEAAELRLISTQLLREMHDMRQLLSRQRNDSDDSRAVLRRQLLGAGFGAVLAEELPVSLPAELARVDAGSDAVQAWLQRRLAARLQVADDPLTLAGTVALVGATGVGKTTTIAKLAARAVMARGPGQVVLVSTDRFRIGAHQQLCIYGDLMGVTVQTLDTPQSLAERISGTTRQDQAPLVLIDTMGMSQRDRGVIQQVGELSQAGASLRLVLLLNAASQPEVIEEAIVHYRQAARAAGARLEDCLLTKLDEAGRLGPVLGAVMTHGLRVLAVTEGQRVPEDLSPADATALVARALSGGTGSEVLSPPAGWMRSLLGHGRRLSVALATLRQRVAGYAQLESAWDLAQLPEPARHEELGALLANAPPADTVWWARRGAVAGGDWSMADLTLDAWGWQALPMLQHHQAAGERERFAAVTCARGASRHLLPRLPDRDGLIWLMQENSIWCCAAASGTRVHHRGERQPLSLLSGLAQPAGEQHCLWRGREARLQLFSLPVSAEPSGRRRGETVRVPATAWFGKVLTSGDRRVLASRIWLTSPLESEAAMDLIQCQLQGENILPLARRVRQRLAGSLPGLANTELRTLLACGLAAVAVRLDSAVEDWAMDLRADLISLVGGRRDGVAALVDGLLYLMLGREALGMGVWAREK